MCCRGNGPDSNPDLILPKFPWQLIPNHQKENTEKLDAVSFASDAFRKRDRLLRAVCRMGQAIGAHIVNYPPVTANYKF
jgi:hypothetical protein